VAPQDSGFAYWSFVGPEMPAHKEHRLGLFYYKLRARAALSLFQL